MVQYRRGGGKGDPTRRSPHLENTDTTAGHKLMIHPMGVVGPFDPEETISLSKTEFVAAISGPVGEAG